MQELSRKFHDQFETPLERALFWIEYVLKHPNVEHLNVATRHMYFYESHNLDIILILFTVLFTSIYLVYKTLTICVNCCTKQQNIKIKQT